MNVVVRSITILLTICVGLSAVSATAERLWTYKSDDLIHKYRQSALGSIVVTTKNNIVALDSESGVVQWTRDLKAGHTGLSMIPDTPLAIVHHKDRLHVLDLVTGGTIWDDSRLPYKKIRGYLPVASLGMLLVFGEIDGGSDKSVAGVDITDGSIRWRQDEILSKKPEQVCYDPQKELFKKCAKWGSAENSMGGGQRVIVHDGDVVIYVSKDGPMKLDAETGALVWRVDDVKGKSVPMTGLGMAAWTHSGGILYTVYDKRRIVAVDLSTGSVRWKRKNKLPSEIRQVEMTPEGLLVRGFKPGEETEKSVGLTGKATTPVMTPPTKLFVDLIDAASGQSKWEHPIQDLDLTLPLLADENYAYVIRSRDVIFVDLASGTYNQFAQLPLEGRDTPTGIERVGLDFLVTSPQNMVMLGPRGEQRYHSYYPAPGLSWFQQLAAEAMMLAFYDLVEGDAWDNIEVEQPDGSYRPSNLFDRMEFYSELDPAWKQVMATRFTASSSLAQIRYMFTEKDDTKVLVKVDKKTGEELGRIALKARDPDYQVDPVTQTVFVKNGLKGIYALR